MLVGHLLLVGGGHPEPEPATTGWVVPQHDLVLDDTFLAFAPNRFGSTSADKQFAKQLCVSGHPRKERRIHGMSFPDVVPIDVWYRPRERGYLRRLGTLAHIRRLSASRPARISPISALLNTGGVPRSTVGALAINATAPGFAEMAETNEECTE
jgi:hypothetical protein